MRVKKDRAYVIVSEDRGYVQGAFPHTKEGKRDAEEYVKRLAKKNKQKYKVKLV